MRLKLIPPDEASRLRSLIPAKKKTIAKLRCEAAAAFAKFQSGQQEALLDEWPAQEFSRLIEDITPTSYVELWEKSGGSLCEGGRMIALKNDPIWSRLSRYGLPYPPFDAYDVMWLKHIDRAEAERLGLITRSQKIQPQPRNWDEDVQRIRHVPPSKGNMSEEIKLAVVPSTPVEQASAALTQTESEQLRGHASLLMIGGTVAFIGGIVLALAGHNTAPAADPAVDHPSVLPVIGFGLISLGLFLHLIAQLVLIRAALAKK